jgi:raffinose/stachyose/melibiose transport system permease protein
VAVQAFVGSFVKSWDMILTAALLAMAPMIIIFLIAQKQIMNGMVEGAIK